MKSKTIKLEFEIGDEVFLITDEDQSKRIITGIFLTQNEVVYYLSKGTEETKHYSFEMSYHKNYTLN